MLGSSCSRSCCRLRCRRHRHRSSTYAPLVQREPCVGAATTTRVWGEHGRHNRHRSAEEPHTGANILMVFTSVVNARGGEGGVVEYEAQLQNCSQYKTCRNDLLPPPWLHELD
jgi:hypothetical protein